VRRAVELGVAAAVEAVTARDGDHRKRCRPADRY
jgi:hypothetical protein